MICKDCKLDKSPDEFYKRDTACKSCRLIQRRKYYAENKATIRITQRKYYDENKDKIDENSRRYAFIYNYGITQEQFDEINATQQGKCKICGTDQSSTKKSRLDIDHDHVTGKIRGLLCNKCNQALGLLQDNPELIEKAAKYLRDNS